jgi:hypothetical protein
MTPELKALNEAVRRLDQIRADIASAKAMPERAAAKVSAIHLSNYGSPAGEVKLFKRAKEIMTVEAVSEAEMERDALLAALSSEIHSIRAVLPSLAAKAAISLAPVANDMGCKEGAK